MCYHAKQLCDILMLGGLGRAPKENFDKYRCSEMESERSLGSNI